MSLESAALSCAKLNMSLLAAENSTTLKSMVSKIAGNFLNLFLTKKVSKKSHFFPAYYGKSFDFWTSGANEGEYCDTEKVYSWCSNGKRVRRQEISVNWVDAAKEPTSAERCLSLKTKDADFGLAFAECVSKRSLLCEVRAGTKFVLKTCVETYCEFCF